MPYIPNYKLLRSHVRGKANFKELTCRFNHSDVNTIEALAAKYRVKRSDILRGMVRELERRPQWIEEIFCHLQPRSEFYATHEHRRRKDG